jgi:hypothetical protein
MHSTPQPHRGLSRRNIRALLAALISAAVGKGIETLLGDKIADFLKDFSKNQLFQNWIIPIVIGFIPIVLIAFALTYALLREESEEGKRQDEQKSQQGATEASAISVNGNSTRLALFTPEKEDLLRQLGVVDVTPDIQESEFHPKACMSRTKKRLMFMGILGSKWVTEPIFETFVRRIHLSQGSVQFLLIDPQGRSFARLAELRQGNISTSCLAQFSDFQHKYPSLRVKLYDDMPVFRLVFIDGRTAAISRYKLDREGHFASKQGWDAPHLVLDGNSPWSLYDTFEEYFTGVWNRSTDLQVYLTANPPAKITRGRRA